MIMDNCDDDRFLLQRSLRTHPDLKVIGEMDQGDTVLDYLAGKGPFADRARHPIPDVLLVDAVMPQKGAVEILRWLQDHPMPQLTVFVLSGSVFHEECQQLVDMGAKACYEKTGDLDLLNAIVDEIDTFSHTGRFDRSKAPKSFIQGRDARF
ncbi:response regulator [Pedosphaera parvula]|nr:response regulator [Pedosphaera parvula]